jgi:hypothetical protein
MSKLESKIVIDTKDVTTTIRPESEKGERLTKVISNIQETGLPSNDDLDLFGDQIIQFMKETKKTTNDPKSKQMVDAAKKVVEDVKYAINERNYDEKLQNISRKLKDETLITSIPVTGEDGDIIASYFNNMGPLLLNLGKFIIQDVEFRKLVISIIDVFGGIYSRGMNRMGDTNPNIVEVLKQDIRDTETAGIPNTKEALSRAMKDAPQQFDLTENEKDKLIMRAVKSLNRLKDRVEYRSLFLNLFKVFDQVLDIWYRLKSKPELKKTYQAQTSILNDLRQLIERTSGTSLTNWILSLKKVSAITEEKRYKKIRIELEDLIMDTENRYRTREDIENKIRRIQRHMTELNEKYDQVFRNLFNESNKIVVGIANDPVINQIKDSINNLILEIFVDESGKPSVNAIGNSLGRIRDTFYPIIKDRVTRISLPTLEFDSKKYFFRISDLKINTADFLPENLKVESDFNLQIDLGKLKRQGEFKVRLVLEPFTSDIEGLKFFIKKKSGFKYKDYGTVDLYLNESSILLEFHVKLRKDKVDYIEVSRVSTNLKGLKVKIREAHHDIIDKLVLSIFLPAIRAKLENTINTTLYDSINKQIFIRVNNSLKELDLRKKKEKLRRQNLPKESVDTKVTVKLSPESKKKLKVTKEPHLKHKEGKDVEAKVTKVKLSPESKKKLKVEKVTKEPHHKHKEEKTVKIEREEGITTALPDKVPKTEVDVEVKKEKKHGKEHKKEKHTYVPEETKVELKKEKHHHHEPEDTKVELKKEKHHHTDTDEKKTKKDSSKKVEVEVTLNK